MSRRRARQAVLQVLYRNEFHAGFFEQTKKESGSFYFKNLSQTDSQYALAILKGIQPHKKDIDETIKKHSKNWKRERMPLVDLNIMRLAIFEILFCPEIPDKAALNEALELAKQFGEKKSVSFINGILDQILKDKKTI